MSDFLNIDTALFEGVGEYRIPRILPTTELFIRDWIGFNYHATTRKHREVTGVHCFLYDQQFERLWNFPVRYAQVMANFGCMLSPDYSMYFDFPKAVQIFNHYRKHWIGAYYQSKGVTVIPTIRWALPDSYEWCFDGEPEGGIVAVSNVGVMKDRETRKLFMDGYNEMLTRLQPKDILFFGHVFDDYKGNVHYIYYQQEKGPQGDE